MKRLVLALAALSLLAPAATAQTPLSYDVDGITKTRRQAIETRKIRFAVTADQPFRFEFKAVLGYKGRLLQSENVTVDITAAGEERIATFRLSSRARRKLKTVPKKRKVRLTLEAEGKTTTLPLR